MADMDGVNEMLRGLGAPEIAIEQAFVAMFACGIQVDIAHRGLRPINAAELGQQIWAKGVQDTNENSYIAPHQLVTIREVETDNMTAWEKAQLTEPEISVKFRSGG